MRRILRVSRDSDRPGYYFLKIKLDLSLADSINRCRSFSAVSSFPGGLISGLSSYSAYTGDVWLHQTILDMLFLVERFLVSQALVNVFEFAPCKLYPMPALVCVLEYV